MITPDLLKFEQLFDCIHSKKLSAGLEVRVSNLDIGKHDARQLIKKHNLNLEVSSQSNMVTQRAFLIKPV